jgi:hypothetical protein
MMLLEDPGSIARRHETRQFKVGVHHVQQQVLEEEPAALLFRQPLSFAWICIQKVHPVWPVAWVDLHIIVWAQRSRETQKSK